MPAQLADPALEVKFNPDHDPANGRFTFGDGGGAASSRRRAKAAHPVGQATPVRLRDGSTVANPHSSNGILMQPPGVSSSKNAAEARSWLGITANSHMYHNVAPGGPMDYQRTFGTGGLINKAYIDFGNYNYGVVAAAARYTLEEAQAAAGAINLLGKGSKAGMYWGNPRNQAMIAAGWRDYMNGKVGR